MKLLLCLECSSLVSFTKELTHCKCGKSSGFYKDNINAVVRGTEKGSVLCIGFANTSLITAIRDQLTYGDDDAVMSYAGGMVTKGRDFTSFIIPFDCPTVEYRYNV